MNLIPYFSKIKKKNFLKKKYFFRTYFMKGESNTLEISSKAQTDFFSHIKKDPESKSFMIYSRDQVKSKINKWHKVFPFMKPYFALKANDSKEFLEDVLSSNCGFDVASPSEIAKSLEVGSTPENIVYSNPTKDINALNYAAKCGVFLTAADSVDEIKKIHSVSPKFRVG